MARLGLILVLWALTACAQAPLPFVAGKEVGAPAGWVDYCRRNPPDHDCKTKP